MSVPDKDEQSTPQSKSHLQSANRLIVDAIIAMTSIVESMHHRINPLSKASSTPDKGRTSSLTGLVYKTIYSITELVGKGLDVPLGVISKVLGQNGLSPGREALISALNGVLGDHLVKQESSLAIPMTLNLEGRQLDPVTLAESIKRSNGKLVIMVHGLCMNHLQWQQGDHDHGKALSDDLDFEAVYLHYNTGQHIFENGNAFSHLLEQIVTDALTVVTTTQLEISIVAHSMGGLVSRSAFHHAQTMGHTWPDYFENLVFLGTPHHGAPLEKAGGWLDMLLGIHGYTAPLSRLAKVRSAGIRDLRHGNIISSDCQERHRFDFARDKRTPITLPENVKCYTVATTASTNPNRVSERLIGDGLVPLDSALGRHESKSFTLQFPKAHQWIGRDISHMQLLSNPQVYTAIKNWLATE